jgi:uncharacterized repeat protein (TIGR03803 family)
MVAFKKEAMMANPRRHGSWTLGTWALALAVIATLSAQAQTYTVLHTFQRSRTDGWYLYTAPLVQDSAGNLYGTTVLGGHLWGCQRRGCGTIFEITGKEEKVLYRFDIGEPFHGVILAANGQLYGTAGYDIGTYGLGEVFEASTKGSLTAIYSFRPAPDVSSPTSGVTQDAQGNFYGVANAGGTLGYGGIFKIDTSGHETVLHSFAGSPSDANYPLGNLAIDAAGNLYGTSLFGGPEVCADNNEGCGNVFELSPNSDGSWTESILYTFCSLSNCTDGYFPYSGVILDKSGDIYGTTAGGGNSAGGTVFKLAHNVDGSWTESVLYSFCSLARCLDGAAPTGGLVFDSSGNLYGTTLQGALKSKKCLTNEYNQYGCGTVFKLDTSNNETVLHRFNGLNGATPYGGLLIDASGNLYGTTNFGGYLSCDYGYPGCGVVYKITP